MSRSNLSWTLIAACVCSVLFFLGLSQLKIDFSRSSYVTGDFVDMFPLSTWIYLSLLPLWLLFTYKFNKRLSWTIPFILVVILFLAFPLAQYPNIFHLDTFYHSAAAKRIATQGNLQIDMPYMVYPGAPILSAILSEISGIPILETAIVLSSSWILLIFVLLFCIGRLLTKTSLALDEMSWLAPAIYLAFNFMFYKIGRAHV